MPTTRNSNQLSRILPRGVIAGIIGGVLMVIFVMIASATYLHMGFCTPLYAIAAPLIGQHPLRASIPQGSFYLIPPRMPKCYIAKSEKAGYASRAPGTTGM